MENPYSSISILNSNVCTTYRMDFCEESIEYKGNPIKSEEIYPHKSQNRLDKIFKIYTSFYEKNLQNSIDTIFTIQELRTYNKNCFKDYFNSFGYKLFLFYAYPGIVTEDITIDNDEEFQENINSSSNLSKNITYQKLKRFSFINAIAIPNSFSVENEFSYYLSDTPDKFSTECLWGNSGSRICGGLELKAPSGVKFKIFTTQFGMEVEERLKSANLIANIFLLEKLPVILTGDFNSFTNLDENIDHKATEQLELLGKSFVRVPNQKGTFIGIRPVEKEKYCIDLESGFMANCLDHIFLKGDVEVVESDLIEPDCKNERLYPFSDHCMIWASLRIK